MRKFKAPPLKIPCSKTIKPFRTEDSEVTYEALLELEPPFDSELEAELVALTYVHWDVDVRKKAKALVDAHVVDAGAFKKAYSTLANKPRHIIESKIRAFDHPLQLEIAKAVLYYTDTTAISIVFEKDAVIRKQILAVMVDFAKVQKESQVCLSEYWLWWERSGACANLNFHELPPTLFAELGRLRKHHAFDGVSLRGGSLTTLPDDINKARWLKDLSLSSNGLTALPDALFGCINLNKLDLSGTELRDIPDAIAKLKKLRHLDLSDSKMAKIPASVCALDKLEVLDVSSGGIWVIPKEISQMRSLRELDISRTRTNKVPQTLGQLPKLEKVHMKFCPRLSKHDVKAVVGKSVKVYG